MDDYKIIMVDDHNLVSEGLAMLISENNLGSIVAKVENGRQLLEVLNSQKADMILMDVDMPVMDGLKAAELTKFRHPAVKILIVTQHNSIELMKKFQSLNVEGYLLKSSDRTQLVEAIKKIKNGEKEFPLLKNHQKSPVHHNRFLLVKEKYGLSERECEIIILITMGLTSERIAEKLYLSKLTVDTHRKHIGRKTGAHNPAAIMKFAIENNINQKHFDDY